MITRFAEQVTPGHPDKVADQIADTILDTVLEQDPMARVAIEALITGEHIALGGETATDAHYDTEEIARRVIADIGYSEKWWNGVDSAKFHNFIQPQSADLNANISEGAGDQGVMYGYACNTEDFLPVEYSVATKVAKIIYQLHKDNPEDFGPDGKTTATVDDQGNVLHVTAAILHALPLDEARRVVEEEIRNSLNLDIPVDVNTSGPFTIGGPAGDTGLCLASGSMVTCPDGLKPIEELQVGDTVITETGKANIVEHYSNGIKKTFVIKDSSGVELEATGNHPFRVLDENEEVVWRRADELKEGDYILKKKAEFLSKENRRIDKIKSLGLSADRDFYYLMGWLLGDGNTTATGEDRLTFYYNYTDPIEKAHIHEKLSSVFGEERVKSYEHQNDRFLILSKPLYRELIEKGYMDRTTSRFHRLPKQVFTANDTLKGEFLSGLFDADGYITISGRKDDSFGISLATSSKKLAQDVSIVLQAMGISSSIYERMNKYGGFKNGKQIIANGPSYDVKIIGKKSTMKFLSKVGFKHPKKRALYANDPRYVGVKQVHYNDGGYYPLNKTVASLLNTDTNKKVRWFPRHASANGRVNRNYTITSLQKIVDFYDNNPNNSDFQKIKYFLDNDISCSKVVSIEESESETWDISLDDETHSFIANGMIVHNTGRKIIADSYGGKGRHGGGAFSGKDARKVDRTGAYYARSLAIEALKELGAGEVEVQIGYSIGDLYPRSLNVLVDGVETEWKPSEGLLTPWEAATKFNLRTPLHAENAKLGHFTRSNMPWNN